MQTLDTSAARSLTHEMISLRNEIVDWQIGQMKKANEQGAELMKTWASGLELSERITRAWTQTVVDTFLPAPEKTEA
ncbi:MAG: hypothetical protein H6741_28800 [Alphaproteobacteria bacterium]|nr:hypothetical protein [Alphaproteobacteria bacterium]